MNDEAYQLELPGRYDDYTKMVLPHYDMFFGTVIEFIPKKAVLMLELASGTGFLTSLIRQTFPDTSITCCDINPEMMAVAKKKKELSSVFFCTCDITKKLPDGRYDVIVVTQCLFALPREEIPGVFRRIRQALAPGGVFVYGDIFEPEDSWEMRLYASHWRDQMQNNGMTPIETEIMIGPLESFIKGYHLSYAQDELKKAGFSRVIVPYWYEMYGVMVAYTSV